MKIKEFKINDKIKEFFIIKSVQKKVSSTNNNMYLDLILIDKTGEINAKYWRATEEDIENFTVNSIVLVKGSVIEWLSQPQIRIDKISLKKENDDIEIENLVPSAPRKSQEMYSEVLSFIDEIENKDIKDIVLYMVEERKEKLLIYPAAMKNHHSVRGGLLYHITTMLNLGRSVCNIYKNLRSDFVYAGVILHDLLKIEEMEASSLGIVSEYSTEGKLLGHIVQGIKALEVVKEMTGADNEVITMLQHIILTHHYQPEYGSPKKPMFPEAEVIHFLDDLDAKMYDMNKALNTTAAGEFSEGIWSLDKRRVYKSIFDSKE